MQLVLIRLNVMIRDDPEGEKSRSVISYAINTGVMYDHRLWGYLWLT